MMCSTSLSKALGYEIVKATKELNPEFFCHGEWCGIACNYMLKLVKIVVLVSVLVPALRSPHQLQSVF